MQENGKENCNCPKENCIRHGNCAECADFHKANKRYPPYCMGRRAKDKKKNITG